MSNVCHNENMTIKNTGWLKVNVACAVFCCVSGALYGLNFHWVNRAVEQLVHILTRGEQPNYSRQELIDTNSAS